ncbi:hypothetical protein IQ07DRAFT_254182 [Pyrenochaeta sp. DS3sAY3a]|nr:hypothetical protein IQ07DRAFT_254182 [Pyrenochaeta sp. DS3sAY3a]
MKWLFVREDGLTQEQEHVRERSEVIQQPNWVAIATPTSTYPLSNQPVETLYESHLPPSIRLAVENSYYAPHVENPYQGPIKGYSSSEEDFFPPFSPDRLAFSSRSLQSGQNYGLDEYLTAPESSSFPIIHQATDLDPRAVNFLGLQTTSGNPNRNSLSSFSGSSSHGSLCSRSHDSLQYHLIGASTGGPLETRSAAKRHLTPESSRSSQATSNNDDEQTKSCPICKDTSYRGNDARRNLNRHMENKHPTGGAKQYLCKECGSTFSRNDAFLVHARRSHPEMDVPAAKPRKKVKTTP